MSKKKIAVEKLDAVLAHKFTPSDTGQPSTVRSYLANLLLTLLGEGESFSGKRPFGNSGWESNFIIPLIQCGAIKGVVMAADEENDWPAEAEGYDQSEADDAMDQVVAHMCGVELA